MFEPTLDLIFSARGRDHFDVEALSASGVAWLETEFGASVVFEGTIVLPSWIAKDSIRFAAKDGLAVKVEID